MVGLFWEIYQNGEDLELRTETGRLEHNGSFSKEVGANSGEGH